MKLKNSLRILVADDFVEWRLRVRSMLHSRPQLQIVGEACNGLQAVQRAAELHPDIVLMDIGMPVLNGIEAAKRIWQESPDSRIIFVTANSDSDIRSLALASGADGYLLKANAKRELLPALERLHCVISDYAALPPQLNMYRTAYMRNSDGNSSSAHTFFNSSRPS